MDVNCQCTLSMLFRCLKTLLISVIFAFEAQAQIKVWVNDGGDKVTQDELRAHNNAPDVFNSIWDGSKVNLFAAKNEVVAFNVIIEAPSSLVSNVSVKFDTLIGPNGSLISSRAATGDGIFDWRGRNIELFKVQYLQIKGVSTNTFSNYDERHTPERMRRPWSGAGYASGTWYDRPDHDKYYPDIAVPLEAAPTFSIAARSNQSIWSDIYVPKSAPSGLYTGTLTISINGASASSIPVQLMVRNFALPDMPSAKTMLMYSPYEVNERYLGAGYVNPLGANGPESIQIRQRHFQVAHRHKISLIDTNYEFIGDQPSPYEWPTRLDGSLFTPASGYDGPGVSVGNNVFAIGVYGSWNWKGQGESAMWQRTNNWEQWFRSNSPNTERFLYLEDESHDYPQLQQWSEWVRTNPGVGSNLPTLATVDLPTAVQKITSLLYPASTFYIGDPNVWAPALTTLKSNPKRKFYSYNGHRPTSGSFAIEDDGTALRELAWGQYRLKVDRWFFWQSTYYNNTEGATGQTNVFRQAQTFGTAPTFDSAKGLTGRGYSNGDGVLFYPGKDKLFPADSYNLNGPIASLRLKHWRRGIQDVDYLTLAYSINPTATKQILDAVLPKALWEYGVDDPSDPSWKRGDIVWSNDPNVWEQARVSLASIIETGAVAGTATPTRTPTPAATSTSVIPSAPTNLSAAALVHNQLALTWRDTSNNEVGFKIERSIDGTNFSEIASVAANVNSYNDTGLNSWTTYAYRIRSYNSSGHSAYSALCYKTTLTTSAPTPTPSTGGSVPSVPIGLSAAALVSNQLTISWTDNSSNESGFKIERSINGVTFTEAGIVAANRTSFTDVGLNAWTTYAYRIRAYNANGHSAYSAYVYKTTLTTNGGGTATPTPAPLSPPSSLSGSYYASWQAKLLWRDNSSNESGFRIERSTDGVNFSIVAQVSANTTSYTNTGLARWTTYAFRVRAINGTSASAPSNVTYVSTPQ